MRDRDLEGFRVQLLGIGDCLTNRFARFTRQSDDEISMNPDACAFAVLDKLQSALRRDSFLDILENLFVSGLEADNKKSAAGISHDSQGLVIKMGTRCARPLEFERFEGLAHLDHSLWIEGESIVVEEDLLQSLRLECIECPLDLMGDIPYRALPPAVVIKCLGP